MPLLNNRVLTGWTAGLGGLLLAGQDYLAEHWESALVWFAGLVLAPEGWLLLGARRDRANLAVAAGMLLPLAYLAPLPWLGRFLAMFYASIWMYWVIDTVRLMVGGRAFDLQSAVRLVAAVYGFTGSLWAVSTVWPFSPLGFDPVITALTAAHFMVAGFVLTCIIYLLLGHQRNVATIMLGYFSLVGMPSVAAGITLSKFGASGFIETVAAGSFALVTSLVAIAQMRIPASGTARLLLLTGSLCLLCGLAWAFLYAIRFYWPLPAVHIPNMKIWHGTVQAMGFGGYSLLGWRCFLEKKGRW